jgi:hypothetical protein
MHSSVIKQVVDRVSEVIRTDDPFLVDHRTTAMCNDVLVLLTKQAGRSPMFACSIWHYLLDHQYQIGNCADHGSFVTKFKDTLATITPEKRVMLRRISDKLFVRANQLQA